MAKNKVIHARIDDDIHDRLLEKCNELGCSFTDYIQSIISASLEEPSKAETTPINEEMPRNEGEIIGIESSELTNVRISS